MKDLLLTRSRSEEEKLQRFLIFFHCLVRVVTGGGIPALKEIGSEQQQVRSTHNLSCNPWNAFLCDPPILPL